MFGIRVSSILKTLTLMAMALLTFYLSQLFYFLHTSATHSVFMEEQRVALQSLEMKPHIPRAAGINPQVSSEGHNLIIAWTPLTKKKPLWNISSKSFSHCEYHNCTITSHRTKLDQADLLLFSIRQLKKLTSTPLIDDNYMGMFDLDDMPPYHKYDQIWMNVNRESPIYTLSDEELSPLDYTFNLTVTYKADSDFSFPYIPYIKSKTIPSPPVDYSAGKTKMALWFVSHCDAQSGRDDYVKALQEQGIDVDIFGKCTGRNDGCTPGNFTCYTEVRRQYRFYLALENSVCNEYITEKFWDTLNSPAYNIPVALGASLTDYKEFAPPDSYIHTRNFTGVKALAEYMKKIASDDQLFNRYHEWRQDLELVPKVTGTAFHCYMCEAANRRFDGHQRTKRLSSYWSKTRLCDINREPTGLS